MSQKRPIFADDEFEKICFKSCSKDRGYDVAIHGAAKYVSFYGKCINADTLADIIKTLTDYDGESNVRLLSCNTGKGEKCFVQSLDNKLGVSVEAPDDIIWARADGTFTIGPTKYKNTGQMITLDQKGRECMKEISNVREFSGEESFPTVKTLVSKKEIPEKGKILQFLKSFNSDCAAGMVLVDEITGENVDSGISVYEDGQYYWDTRHIYHFEKYNLKLNDDFIAHVLGK